jgi:hypothetical protein
MEGIGQFIGQFSNMDSHYTELKLVHCGVRMKGGSLMKLLRDA